MIGGVRLHRALSCSNVLVLAFYTGAGLAGASASAFLGPRHTYTVGASGAICGLQMATLALTGTDSALEARAPSRPPFTSKPSPLPPPHLPPPTAPSARTGSHSSCGSPARSS